MAFDSIDSVPLSYQNDFLFGLPHDVSSGREASLTESVHSVTLASSGSQEEHMHLRTIANRTRLHGLHRAYTGQRSSSSMHRPTTCVSIPPARVVSP